MVVGAKQGQTETKIMVMAMDIVGITMEVDILHHHMAGTDETVFLPHHHQRASEDQRGDEMIDQTPEDFHRDPHHKQITTSGLMGDIDPPRERSTDPPYREVEQAVLQLSIPTYLVTAAPNRCDETTEEMTDEDVTSGGTAMIDGIMGRGTMMIGVGVGGRGVGVEVR